MLQKFESLDEAKCFNTESLDEAKCFNTESLSDEAKCSNYSELKTASSRDAKAERIC
jgi:hypothetical protein